MWARIDDIGGAGVSQSLLPLNPFTSERPLELHLFPGLDTNNYGLCLMTDVHGTPTLYS